MFFFIRSDKKEHCILYYAAETTYKYVGKGAGEFETVTVPTNIKPGYFYCVVAFALVAVVVYLLNPMAPTTTTTAPDIIIPTRSSVQPYSFYLFCDFGLLIVFGVQCAAHTHTQKSVHALCV